MNKKVKRRIALFFISVCAASIFSTTVFATSSDPSQSPASSATSVAPSSIPSVDPNAESSRLAAESAAKVASAKAASASAYAASKLAAQKLWWKQHQASIAASLAAMSSSELESSMVSSEESSSLDISLPSVGDVSGVGGLTESGTEVPGKSFNLIGVISLACIGLGVLIVLAVLFSANRRPPRGGSGRTRYRKPHRSKKKRLLNDKYYRNMRY